MSDTPAPILSSGENDATQAYLFRARDDEKKSAITFDRSGAILPVTDGVGEWLFQQDLRWEFVKQRLSTSRPSQC